jgi:hypothetical protein
MRPAAIVMIRENGEDPLKMLIVQAQQPGPALPKIRPERPNMRRSRETRATRNAPRIARSVTSWRGATTRNGAPLLSAGGG